MKKNLLIGAAVLAVALPFFSSCGKPNDPDKPDTVIVMQDPPTMDEAKLLEFPKGKTPKFEDDKGKYDIVQIEFTESNRFLLKRQVLETKAKVGDIQMIVGKYTKGSTAGQYILERFGKVTIQGSQVTIEPEGELNKNNKYSGNANIKTTPTPSTQDQKNADRNWKIESTTLEVDGDGVRFSRDFTGCDLHEMAAFAKKNKAKVDPDDFVGFKVVEFIFTGNNTFVINFEDAPAIEGTYKINASSKTINFTLSGNNPFFSGSIPGTYEYPADKKMNMVLKGSIKGYEGSMTFIMTQN